MTPKRIQRRRARGWRMPEGAIYVGRPSRWGNEFVVERFAHSHRPWRVLDWRVGHGMESADTRWFEDRASAQQYATDMYREWVAPDLDLAPLAGHDLACWCPLDQPCHADVLLDIANGGEQ